VKTLGDKPGDVWQFHQRRNPTDNVSNVNKNNSKSFPKYSISKSRNFEIIFHFKKELG